jgi:hypothetical protein
MTMLNLNQTCNCPLCRPVPAETLKAGVDDVVARLDTVRPAWREKINLERLDIASPNFCVLGQVFGDFFRGLFALRIDDKSSPAGIAVSTSAAEPYWRQRIMETEHVLVAAD